MNNNVNYNDKIDNINRNDENIHEMYDNNMENVMIVGNNTMKWAVSANCRSKYKKRLNTDSVNEMNVIDWIGSKANVTVWIKTKPNEKKNEIDLKTN